MALAGSPGGNEPQVGGLGGQPDLASSTTLMLADGLPAVKHQLRFIHMQIGATGPGNRVFTGARLIRSAVRPNTKIKGRLETNKI
jgi:hypothetical protein